MDDVLKKIEKTYKGEILRHRAENGTLVILFKDGRKVYVNVIEPTEEVKEEIKEEVKEKEKKKK